MRHTDATLCGQCHLFGIGVHHVRRNQARIQHTQIIQARQWAFAMFFYRAFHFKSGFMDVAMNQPIVFVGQLHHGSEGIV